MKRNSNNYINKNFSHTPNRIKIKKKILDFPKYMSNEELRYIQKRIKKNIVNINDTNTYLQQHNIFQETKSNIPYKYIQELKRLNEIENNKNNSAKKNESKILNKKINSEKNNKRFLSSTNRKILEYNNQKIPSNLFDFIHPHEYYFTQRRIKNDKNNSEINYNKNDKNNLILKNSKDKKEKISKLFIDNIINNSEKKSKNRKNIFLTLYKRNQNKIKSINSSKILLDNNNRYNLTEIKNNEFFNKNKSNIIYTKNNVIINEEEEEKNNKNNYDKIENKKLFFNKINNDNHISKRYNTEINNNIKNINNSNNNINNKSSPSNFIIQEKKSNKKINNNDYKNIILDRNYFSQTSRLFNKNKKYFISSENNISKTSNFLNKSNSRNKRIFNTEPSLIKKKNKDEFLKEITNINEQLNEIKNDIISKKEYDDNNLERKFEEIKKITKEDMIVANILVEKGRVQMQSTKELFKKMKQKSFISDLTKQYFTCKKTKYETSIKQKFLKELRKIDILEKKDALLRDLAYKKNYEIKKGVNKLKENDLSKERKIFNNKIVKMKQLNINNHKNFIKSINKY